MGTPNTTQAVVAASEVLRLRTKAAREDSAVIRVQKLGQSTRRTRAASGRRMRPMPSAATP